MEPVLRLTSDVIPAGNSLALVANRLGHGVHTLDRSVAEALESREAWSAESLSTSTTGAGITLDWLIDRGIVHPFGVTPPPARPFVTAVVTADRPAACARALTFVMAQQGGEQAADHPVLVVDNSVTVEGRDGTERAVIAAVQRHRRRAIIVDRRTADRLAEAVSTIDAAAGEAVRFALQQRVGSATNIGCARNLVGLLTRGCAVLSIDDDVMGPALQPRAAVAGFRFGADGIGLEPLSDVDMSDWCECNLLDAHRGSLGSRVAGSEAEEIVLTMSGLRGDCGADGPWGEICRPALGSRRRLTRNVFRGVLQPTVTTATSGLMCFAFGLVNDGAVPPFMPIGRNEDGAFAMMLHATRPTARLGHLAVAVRHAPLEPRDNADYRDLHRALAQPWRTNDLVLRLAAQTRPLVDASARLAHLIDTLRELAEAIQRGVLTELRDQYVAHQASHAVALARWQEVATWWERRRAGRALARWQSSALSDEAPLPAEWTSIQSGEFGRYLEGCASMLARWPHVVAAIDALPAWRAPWTNRSLADGVRHVEPH
jgi:hypothetical protein